MRPKIRQSVVRTLFDWFQVCCRDGQFCPSRCRHCPRRQGRGRVFLLARPLPFPRRKAKIRLCPSYAQNRLILLISLAKTPEKGTKKAENARFRL
jgi:hypothetical protein